MDLQLYRVDGSNYLVDFRNIGYYHTTDKSIPEARIPSSALGTTPPSAPASQAGSLPAGSLASVSGTKASQAGGVSGPFHFLEMACQLIAELASG
jgi:carbon catabolite-derepressing protein kinase